ncbi:IS4 family transposase [Sinorhizobium fredii]|uniref:IS4/IS5 family transposase n=1 Tax=Rhizobium fredii TaxID=380 RepID=A0A2A6LN96_RHIFR|nr:IS4 family transposase [Sinorhizobium fredii]PDT43848.1 IS4/IS5 family transposase [Sinorhizobium fredii]
MSDSLQALDWGELVGRLGSAAELEASAREAGALLRKRQVAGAVDLLRLCFAYVLGRFSLRTLAAWAEQRGLASMSDVAMLKRLKASADWVGSLVSLLLAERCPEAVAGLPGGLRMMAVDATVVAPPGPKRDYFMVHTVFDLSRLQLCSVEVTDRHDAERLSRGARPGELRIADRAYARATDLARAVAAGADFLVRAPSNYPRLLDSEGQVLDRLALCREAAEKGVLDRSVQVQDGKSKLAVAARVVIFPLPPEAAEKARRAARRLAAKASYAPSQAGIEMAGYLVLLTSLAPDDWPPERLASTYRLRWQIELAFKRMKSLVGLEDLRAKDPDLARLWINTALLAALLAEDDLPALDPEAPDSLPLAA